MKVDMEKSKLGQGVHLSEVVKYNWNFTEHVLNFFFSFFLLGNIIILQCTCKLIYSLRDE